METSFGREAQNLQNIVEQYKNSCDVREEIVTSIYGASHEICKDGVTYTGKSTFYRTEKLDKIFTSPIWGFPIMLLMLAIVLYITIAGANVPSSMLADFFSFLEGKLTILFTNLSAPEWLHGVLVLGLFRGVGQVISVMLPPMAIFFPMFSLLENYGYLPRVAFNMDRLFKTVGAHGKQAITMTMGFGCNAAAVISTRIIESPRERMIALITNNFVPCNGRWPTLILIASLFMASGYSVATQSFITVGVVVGMVLIGIIVTLFVSFVLSKTLLRGMASTYTLELPPFRKPKFGETIIRASIDKSWSVLKRAVIVAAPAAVLTWVLANITIGDTSILLHVVNFFDPFGQAIGLDGYIITAFVLGLPANEIVLPILFMSYLATGSLTEVESASDIKNIFLDNGWTILTALNMMLFSLLHYPCGTTLINIYKETKSYKWTFLSFIIPLAIAIIVTFTTTQIYHLFIR